MIQQLMTDASAFPKHVAIGKNVGNTLLVDTARDDGPALLIVRGSDGHSAAIYLNADEFCAALPALAIAVAGNPYGGVGILKLALDEAIASVQAID